MEYLLNLYSSFLNWDERFSIILFLNVVFFIDLCRYSEYTYWAIKKLGTLCIKLGNFIIG